MAMDRGPSILLSRHVPPALVMRMAGRPLREVVDHPLIDPSWVITHASIEVRLPSHRKRGTDSLLKRKRELRKFN